MIKGGAGPGGGVVAQRAIGREAGCDVCRIGGPGKVLLVAAVAGGRQRRVIVVDVALRAGDLDVRAGQRKRRIVVVETRPAPVGGAVAGGAGGREACSGVGWSVRPGVIRFVAAVAVLRQRGVVVIGVAARAGGGGVSPGQGEH